MSRRPVSEVWPFNLLERPAAHLRRALERDGYPIPPPPRAVRSGVDTVTGRFVVECRVAGRVYRKPLNCRGVTYVPGSTGGVKL